MVYGQKVEQDNRRESIPNQNTRAGKSERQSGARDSDRPRQRGREASESDRESDRESERERIIRRKSNKERGRKARERRGDMPGKQE